MSVSTAPSAKSVSPAQIWATLNADLQGRVIRFLAQLAFNLLTAQTEPPINKENVHVISADQSQDSP
jgi:hypothetical protein